MWGCYVDVCLLFKMWGCYVDVGVLRRCVSVI